MAEPTHAPTPPASPEAYGRCHWHGGFADDVRLISTHDAGSGHGSTIQFACAPCRRAHNLTPLADRP